MNKHQNQHSTGNYEFKTILLYLIGKCDVTKSDKIFSIEHLWWPFVKSSHNRNEGLKKAIICTLYCFSA